MLVVLAPARKIVTTHQRVPSFIKLNAVDAALKWLRVLRRVARFVSAEDVNNLTKLLIFLEASRS